MAKRREKDSERFRIYTSDRSGLEYGFKPITSLPNAYTRESGKPTLDKGLKIAPSEFDSPPPSQKSLGGEGDISGDPRSNSDSGTPSNVYLIPPESQKVVVSVTSSNSISWNLEPVVYLSTSLNLTMAVNPQLIAGGSLQTITLMCVGSNVTLNNGSGLTLRTNKYLMSSGSLISFIYDSAWLETSRSTLFGDLGVF